MASFLVELEGFFLRKRFVIMNPLFGFSSLIKTKKRYLMASFLVELEGFEPSSKRGTNELSTCLAFTWFS